MGKRRWPLGYAAPEAPFRQENLDKMLPAAALYLGSEASAQKKVGLIF
jgi:hypothetical protein